MTTDRNNGADTGGRDRKGRFSAGNPGRPRGAQNHATRAVQRLLDGDAERLTEKAIELAINGDTTALKLCLDRISPAPKDKPVTFELPGINTANDAAKAAASVLEAVAQGEVTPLEGASVMGLIEGYRKTLETSELEKRITDLEND